MNYAQEIFGMTAASSRETSPDVAKNKSALKQGSLKTDTEHSNDILDVEGAAAFLKLRPGTVYMKARLGIIPGCKKCGKWLFSRRKLLELVEAG